MTGERRGRARTYFNSLHSKERTSCSSHPIALGLDRLQGSFDRAWRE